MTNEEAIKLLVNATYSDEWQGNEDLTTAHNMAIKALEQQPCEDTVSRQAAIDALQDVSKYYTEKGRKWHPHVDFMVDAIKDLPPVTSQQKIGKWVKEYIGCTYDVCSECKQKITTGYFEYNYCPNCGAKMESEVEE